MVTTIKITCDGVFIQSNSFLTSSSSNTNSITNSDNSLHNNHDTTTTSLSSSSTSSSLSTSPKTYISDKDKSLTSILNCDNLHKLNSSSSSQTSTNSTIRTCQKSLVSGSTHSGSIRPKRPRTPKCDSRRRYYFGSNKIYWCKQSPLVLGSCCYKSDLPPLRSNCNGLQRSNSSITHKELQQRKQNSHTGRSRHKLLTATSSLTSVPNHNNNQQKSSQTNCLNSINQHNNKYNCSKTRTTSSPPKTISGATSICLVNGFRNKIPVYNNNNNTCCNDNNNINNNNKCYAPDTRLISFLRSARKLYRNSVRVNNNNNTNQKHYHTNNDVNSSSINNTKAATTASSSSHDLDNKNTVYNLNLSKTKNRFIENVTETKLNALNNNNKNSNNSLSEKLKSSSYIFNVKNFSSNLNNNNNNFTNNNNNINSSNNNTKNIENHTNLSEEWFG